MQSLFRVSHKLFRFSDFSYTGIIFKSSPQNYFDADPHVMW